MNLLEWVAAAFGVVSVWLSTREHIGSWPTALVNTALYFVVLQRAHLYANAWLQVFYFALSLYGWYEWKFGGAAHTGVQVTRTPPRILALLTSIAVVATVALGLGLSRYTDSSSPWLDAGTTAVSLVAQWMLTRKLRENWGVWAAVNVVYIGLYASQGLWPTVMLYVAFLGLAIHGWRSWGATLAERERAVMV
jgi:nicotinamide mononucleotide transporter